MTNAGPLTLTATTSTELRVRGQEKHLKHWLAEARPELSPDNRRQICHHARKLLDLVGCLVPATIPDSPDTVEDWIAALDLPAAGLDPRRKSHLARAARALYAAVNDLPPEKARAVMDRKGRRVSREGAAPQTLTAEPGSRTSPPPIETAPRAVDDATAIVVYRERADGTQAPLASWPLGDADMPLAFQFLEKAIGNHAAVDRAIGATDGDVRATARQVLAAHSPAVRMGLVSRLPGIEAVRVNADGGCQASPLAVCDAIILAFLEARNPQSTAQPAAAA
jgi:hypothetical protein